MERKLESRDFETATSVQSSRYAWGDLVRISLGHSYTLVLDGDDLLKIQYVYEAAEEGKRKKYTFKDEGGYSWEATADDTFIYFRGVGGNSFKIKAEINRVLGGDNSIKENFERENEEEAVETLLGVEDTNVEDMSDEELSIFLNGLVDLNNIEESIKETITVMKDLKADSKNIIEAIAANYKMKLKEAREVYLDSSRGR